MRAEILATGEEIRSGSVIDTNSAFIALRLEDAGIQVRRHCCVGDDVQELAGVLQEMARRSEIIVVTGGLGPTNDDNTAEGVALAAGVELALSSEALQSVESFFRNRRGLYSPVNRKQARQPIGSTCIPNPIGTAPGFHIKIDACTVYCVPGVPHEMRRMISEDVLPLVESSSGRSALMRRMTVFGMTEAAVAEQLAEFDTLFPRLRLGLCAVFPEISVRISRRGEEDSAEKTVENAGAWILERLAPRVISNDGKSMAEVVGEHLRNLGATIGVAESCTGGFIASMLTDVSGSSDYFKFCAVTYSNESKMEVLGVNPQTIDRCGAVHEETAIEMAAGTRQRANAVYGLATTGIAGPTGGSVDKPVGTLCIGLSGPTGTQGRRYHFRFDDRELNKKIFAYTALNVLRRRLVKRMGQT